MTAKSKPRPYQKMLFNECSNEVQQEVLNSMAFVKWDEKKNGHRSKLIITFKNGKFYGYGLV